MSNKENVLVRGKSSSKIPIKRIPSIERIPAFFRLTLESRRSPLKSLGQGNLNQQEPGPSGSLKSLGQGNLNQQEPGPSGFNFKDMRLTNQGDKKKLIEELEELRSATKKTETERKKQQQEPDEVIDLSDEDDGMLELSDEDDEDDDDDPERHKQNEAEKKVLSEELEAERQSRQKLLSAQYELEERLDSLQRFLRSVVHSLSDGSTNSQQESTLGDIADAGHVLRMQNTISALQNELSRVTKRAADLEEGLLNVATAQNVSLIERALVTRKKEREYLGMFEYKLQDEGAIIEKLIIELKPKTAITLLPGLPAYILFMMLRHMDHVADEPKMHALMKAVRAAVKETLRKRSDSTEHCALWLANMLRLLNNVRQYSGEAQYQTHNTARQNHQCLRVFDLSEYRQVLSDTAVSIYHGLIQLLQKQLDRLIMPAILEHEEISGLGGIKRQPPSPSPSPPPPPPPSPSPPPPGAAGPTRLEQELSATHHHLHATNVDAPLRVCIFKQLFYYICAYSLNQLLLRKDLCCWAKGLLIRNNISHLENWIREHLAEYGQKEVEEILGVLQPITQAVQLLQARKSMADVQSTVDMCANLTAMQVCKILKMYTPTEEYEVKVTREFIDEIQKKMQQRAGPALDKETQNLLMDCKRIFSVQFPFCPSPVRLEDIELPEVLGLAGLLTNI